MRFKAEIVYIVFQQKGLIDSIWSNREGAEARLKIVKDDNDENAYIRAYAIDSTEN